MRRLISLLSDFGSDGPFVAEMKAVILSIHPGVGLVDITHEVEPYNIRMGAFLLASATRYFPKGTVHIAVVDPGAGSKRRPLVIQTNRSLFVGPDNGLLIPAASHEGILRVYNITNTSLMRTPISSTSHGRDIFAPVAAHLACGASPTRVGERLTDYQQLSFGEPQFSERGMTCDVIHVDHFGNVVTNIANQDVDRLRQSTRLFVAIRRKRLRAKLVNAYANIHRNEIGLIVGSYGFLEIATREKNASKTLRADVGDSIRVILA